MNITDWLYDIAVIEETIQEFDEEIQRQLKGERDEKTARASRRGCLI